MGLSRDGLKNILVDTPLTTVVLPCCSQAEEKFHARARLSTFAHKPNTATCTAAVIHMYGLHGAKRDQGAREPSGGSRAQRTENISVPLGRGRLPNGTGRMGPTRGHH